MKVQLVGQSYSSRSLAASAQVSINVYPEKIEDPNEKAKNIAVLYGCPQKHLFATLTSIDAAATPVRGVWSGGGRLFVAAGTKYFELSSVGALVGSVRTIADDATHTPVQFFPNGNQLFIVSAGIAYCDNGSGPTAITFTTQTGTVNTFTLLFAVSWVSGDKFNPAMTTITIAGTPYTIARFIDDQHLWLTSSPGNQTGAAYTVSQAFTPRTGAFLDGYFIGNSINTRSFNISAINNGLSWAGLDYGVKESYTDYIQSILANDEQLYLFGTETFEVWQNTGAASFPFERIDGATGRYGSVSPWGPIALDGKVYFVGGNSQGQISAYVLEGFTPRRISTYAAEEQWNAAGLGANCISYAYLEEGHSFWVINFGSQAWAYDVTTGAWHQRYAYAASAFAAYATCFHTFIPEWNKHITGGQAVGATGSEQSALFVSSVNFYDDNGADWKWQRALPYNYAGGNRMYFGRMTLEMQTGTVASGAAPTVSRDYSDDRGNTFSTPVTASMGIHNDYSKRVFWENGGSSRNRVWRFSGVGQSKVALVDVDCDVIVGVN